MGQLYHMEPAPQELVDLMAKRRGAARSTPHTWEEYMSIKGTLFTEFGLEDYVDVIMAETQLSPIPHMFEASRVRPLAELYARRAPALFDRIMRSIEPPWQAINKVSKLGWPLIQRPPSKKVWLGPAIQALWDQGAAECLGPGWMMIGKRLQPEEASKEREILVANDDGEAELVKVTKEKRAVKANDTYDCLAARVRLIINPPGAGNYACQPLDTAIHNWFTAHRGSFGHDPNTPGGMRIPHGFVLCLDMKNFDRFTGPVWLERSRIIGGLYQDICHTFRSLPYLTYSASRKKLFFAYPRHDAGMEVQFGSGISAVAPIQKEIFFCIYQEFAETHLGVPPSDSANWVLRGGDARFGFLNYGDDNVVFGDKSHVLAFQEFISQYLEAVPEDPPRFLGFLWTGSDFKLTVSSYLLKTWLNERPPYSNFRKYPMHGWVEKRATFRKKGVPELEDVFRRETELMEGTSLPWPLVEQRAREELLIMGNMFRLSSRLRDLLAEEKDYLLTAEEQMTQLGYEGFTPQETQLMIRRVVGKQWLGVLR